MKPSVCLLVLSIVISDYSDLLAQTSSQNYVSVENVMLDSISNEISLETLSYTQKQRTIRYFDGFGILVQTNELKAAPGGAKDLITGISYDNLFREYRNYLPYASAMNGAFSTTASSPSNWTAYYGIIDDDYAFSEKIYDRSPLHRLTQQSHPGSTWKTNSGHSIKVTYGLNTAADTVRQWVMTGSAPSSPGVYAANSLYKATKKDENGQKSEEFTDFSGKLVLSRRWNGISEKLSTYYVYDNRNLLRVVIPPLANGDQSAISSGKVDSICYNYTYDERNRLIEKRIPGSGWEYLMYDFRDRLVLSQDARLRDENAYKYYYILYDTLSRTVEEGECTEIQNYSLLRNTVKSSNNYIPATRDPFHKLYYDNETVTGTWSMPYSAVYTGIDRATLIRGLLAGEEVRVLETASWLKTVNYYDKYNRLIQTIRTLYDDATGKETLSTKYDFAGNIVQTRQVQVFGTNPAVTVNKTFIYDHAGRLLKTEQQIVGDTPNGNVTLAENTYNELGQLITKNLHKVSSGVYLQGLDYSYNIRGWLKSINNPDAPGTDLFALRLLYEDAGSLASLTKENQFNGNISGFIWNRKSYPSGTYTKSAYSFIYDKVDRLNNSYYGEGSSLIASDKYREYDYTYDLNGNIKTLKRNNSSGTVMDNLAYTPENPQGSNRLMKITDSALPVEGFKDVVNTSDYAYDDNGNLIKDLNKGFTGITYNDLNLPLVLIRDANNRITYVYDAAGRKLRQVKKVNGIDTTRHYAGNFEYDNSKNLSLIRMEEGMVTKANGVYSYEYHLRDHLSNTRIVFKPGTGGIVTLLETTDYYPFGMSFSPRQSASVNQYLFSGKELQNEMALDWYDYGARFYDPQIGRFTGLDPIAESFYYVTPYNYAENSPIANIDLWGLQAVSYLAKLEYKRMTSLGNAVHNVSAFLTNSIGVNTYNSAAAAINYVADKADVASNFGAAAAVTGVMDDVNQTVDNFTTPISGAGVVEGLTNVENWEGAATAVFGAYLGSKTFSSETSSSTTLNKGVQSVDNASSNKSIYAPKDNNGNLITTQKTKAGNTKIDSEARVTAHTQLRTDKTGNYPQRTTFDSQGRKRADTHFSNHNETGKTNPHKHTYFKDGRRQENNQ